MRKAQGSKAGTPPLEKLPAKTLNKGAPPKGLEDFIQIGPDLWLRECSFPNPVTFWSPSPYLFNQNRTPGDFLFYDTETTGLSGGAGTVPFLVGIGSIEGPRITFRQYFLSDYPGEPEMLHYLKKELDPDKLHVSYNGRTFDSHLLKSRFLMNRMVWTIPPQLDLLVPARRLWKNVIGSCRLCHIEEKVLGISRTAEDVPGSEVPQMYFDFLKNRDARPLKGVFYHNQEDILSLILLLEQLEKIFHTPLDYPQVDQFRLGLMLQQVGRPEGETLIQRAACPPHYRAMRHLSLLHKKARNWEAASALWKEMQEGMPFFAAMELAKMAEHRQKDPQKALEYLADLSPEDLTPSQYKQFLGRKVRLQRKCGLLS